MPKNYWLIDKLNPPPDYFQNNSLECIKMFGDIRTVFLCVS